MPINYLPPSINLPIVAALTTTQYQITWDSSIIGWQEVYQFLLKTASPTVVYLIRDSELVPTLTIPAGVWELKNSNFETKQYGNPSTNAIIVSDGAVLRNLGSISKSCSLRFMSSIPCLEADPLAADSPPVLFFGLGSALVNDGTAPCYISADNSFLVLVLFGAGLSAGVNLQPLVQIGAGSICLLRIDLGGSIDPSGISGPVGSTILLQHDGAFKFATTGLTFTNFFGTIINKPYGIQGGAGPTAFRPDISDPGDLPSVGCYYFDTDLGYTINWNGAAWVDSTGAPV